ncbi:acetyltransferase (GNAT) family protein [Kribbella amoyensis]|uniref:Acetyltransferase (GNAT) family protein n=1 Tax=Kribbella amoyensis TaxID=996641 RepID=A0A561B8J0_9ACTN|nr:GNAT family N-acetyltransferase [Kribbella amoyensis]TWD75274.1 acetyltransferase (GNAT) family protein [Kribbella amoyensis]
MPTAAELAQSGLAAQHPVTRGWAPDEVRLGRLERQFAFDVRLATDLDIATQRAARYAPGRPPEVMLNEWVQVAPDLQAMLSMRYEGGAADKPFVDATPLSRPVEAADLAHLAAAAQARYGELRPRYLRLWSRHPAGWFDGTALDKRYLAAPLASLRGATVAAGLTVAPAESLDRYDDARQAYAAVDAAYPDHPDQAALQSADNLAETLANGLLFDVRVDGEWAGYVAAMTGDDTLGLPAYIVEELILAPAYRGRGYGSSLSTLLADALPTDLDVLLGTIHAANRGAITAATRAGRIDVGGWFQVPLL